MPGSRCAGLLRRHVPDQGHQRRIDGLGIVPAGRARLHVRRRQRQAAEVAVRARSGQQFVQQHADGVDVAQCVGAVSDQALRRHVGDGPDRPGRFDRAGGHLVAARGQAEVEDPHLPGWLDHQVGGLQVAVHQACRVGILHGGGDLADPVERRGAGDAAFLGQLPDGAALHQFHHDRRAGRIFFDGIHGDERRVVQRRRHARFMQRVGVGGRMGGAFDALDRHAALQLVVPGLVHLAIAPGAEARAQFVMAGKRRACR